MTNFTDWITSFFDLITEIFQGTCESLSKLVLNLNTTADNIKLAALQQDFIIAKTLGAIRYIIGDVMYSAIFISITLGALYSVYKIVVAIIKLIDKAKANKAKNIINPGKLLKTP